MFATLAAFLHARVGLHESAGAPGTAAEPAAAPGR
jgi:hypothetical protein